MLHSFERKMFLVFKSLFRNLNYSLFSYENLKTCFVITGLINMSSIQRIEVLMFVLMLLNTSLVSSYLYLFNNLMINIERMFFQKCWQGSVSSFWKDSLFYLYFLFFARFIWLHLWLSAAVFWFHSSFPLFPLLFRALSFESVCTFTSLFSPFNSILTTWVGWCWWVGANLPTSVTSVQKVLRALKPFSLNGFLGVFFNFTSFFFAHNKVTFYCI